MDRRPFTHSCHQPRRSHRNSRSHREQWPLQAPCCHTAAAVFFPHEPLSADQAVLVVRRRRLYRRHGSTYELTFRTALWFSVSTVKFTYVPVHLEALAPTASDPIG